MLAFIKDLLSPKGKEDCGKGACGSHDSAQMKGGCGDHSHHHGHAEIKVAPAKKDGCCGGGCH